MERNRGNVKSALFPTKWSLFIFVAYVTLFVNQGLLVTATKTVDNKFTYNTTVVVLVTEAVKLLIAVAIYLKDEPFSKFSKEFLSNTKVFALYFVPSALYCLYNNLAFVNLAAYDPTTYYILLQFRVVVTGVIYQFLFKKQLSAWQWLSLAILTVGCLIKNFGGAASDSSFDFDKLVNFNLVLILVQVFCSCFAGVYNEYLLKDSAGSVHIMIQNMYMYIDSIICNVMILVIRNIFSSDSKSSDVFSSVSSTLLQPSVLFIIINSALAGIVTSMFLKNLNSILKTFAAAIELVFTALLCYLLFHIPIDIYTAMSIAFVSYATYLYSKHPVATRPINKQPVKYMPLKDLSSEDIESSRSQIHDKIEHV
ncbi:CMP-sialic acid transporter 1 [Halotydeus destructor]|nr:CMP-sialic acid transporter 1 [Halotydeus destructor]